MTRLGLRYPIALLTLIAFAATLGGCTDGGERVPDNVINIGVDAGTFGCSQRTFPAEQPDLSALNPPIFLLTNSRSQQSFTGQAQASPGEAIEAEIWVNGATRRLKVELALTSRPSYVVYEVEEETAGDQTVPIVFFTDQTVRGRYFMRLTLCGFDCDDRDLTEPCGVNGPYDRTLIEDGEVVRVDGTCIDLGSTPGVGSGTVLIQ
jgi:hypothetical protein